MARASIYRRVSRAIARALAPEMGVRRFDAAGWQRFPREARMNRTATETIAAAPAIRSKARYYANNEPFAAAGVNALVTYAVGYGPTPAHSRAEEFKQWAAVCDADGRTDFGGIIANAVRACAVDGESFIQFLVGPDGLRLRLIPAEQIDESKSAELSGGAFIAAGIEFDAQGNRVAYWVRPYLPTAQFETYAPPVRVAAADVLQLMRPVGVGQIRGVSWLAPVLLRLADLGLLSDALLKGFQVAAMHAGFMTDANGAAQLPFDGDKTPEGELDVTLEPGIVRRLPAGFDIKFNNPQAAQNSIEFRTSIVEEIAAGLGVPAFMVSGNVSRANYSSLRAALITFKATLETLQFNVIVPQLLQPIWARWALVNSLRNGSDAESTLPEWRFPPAPEADAVKAAQAQTLLLKARIISRKEAIEERGESIERVDADWDADEFAQQAENDNEPQDDKTRTMRNTMQMRAASLAPDTFDEAERTIEVVLSTGADVNRGGYIERLPIAAADLRGIEGRPVLDAHAQHTTRSVLGVITKAWKKDGEIRARLKLSSRDDVAGTVRDIADGILRSLSVGYRVSKWADTTNSKGERIRTALAWIIHEASFVPIGADAGPSPGAIQ